ncbi:(Fe-S)-binding protein [Streptomyces alanosinicus]|uniref:Cytochrome bc1 complex Rieske iron-sulfur subunit n=1 Tax=Streptomyces alanosinicus TaxID=68171 RepID=A0A919CZI2_9ACTN|nr:(Fe-S)-binding protein [Streptomyces alanosinicus]
MTPVAGLGLAACSAPGQGGAAAATPTAPVDLGADSEVAKGGAKLYRDHNVVVSRDGSGELKAYSTICTHAGCPINKLQGTILICPCHGSQFDAVTGKVVQAPATEPLAELPVKNTNGRIIAGPGA